MSELLTDLRALAETLAGETEHEVELLEKQGEIYVNFDHRRAVVLEPSDEVVSGQTVVHITVDTWDQTGGLADERYLGMVLSEYVPLMVNAYIAGWEAEAEAIVAAFGHEACHGCYWGDHTRHALPCNCKDCTQPA